MRNSAHRALYISKGELDFAARDPSLTILRCQNFVVCGEEHVIFVLLGYHRSYRDKMGAIDWTVAQNSQNFVERNKS
jgi:hypothetical protein